ncbi:MAG TPA: Hsp70 family protein [Kofleriaceae bacterium]|nr:Hsp70 family protein [Kofleriaceae bacterium]
MADPIVGIDLGTTNSVVAVCDQSGAPRVMSDERGTKIHPSVVSFHPNGSVIVGVEAKQRRVIDPRNTVYSAKRLIGRQFRSKEIQAAMGRMPYAIKEGANQQPVLVTRGGEFAVPEISAIVLDHVRNVAKKSLNTEISRAVVTVPASFTDAQRSATATAGAIAGITVVRVLNEPTAAALAYGHQRQLSRTIAVYDFGGGTFDVTILRLQDQVYEVLATAGDSFLGGDDIDEVLMQHMAEQFLATHRIDVRDHEVGVMRLRAVAEQTKIELSRRTRAIVKVDEIAYGPGGAPLNLEVEITRDQLVERAQPFFEKSFQVCEEAMKLAQLGPQQIEDVVLVGGTTKIPHVRERVTRFFQRPPRTDVNPEEAVALGAALQASALERILSRRPSSRMPSSPLPDAAPATFDEAATSEKRTTDRMGATELRAPRTRTERAVQRGEAVDRFEETPTGAKPIARITKPGPAAPPPIPGSAKRTMMGIPVAPGPQPHGEDTGTGELTQERFPTETTREDTTGTDPFAPSAQPTMQIPPGGPLGIAGPAAVGAAIAVGGREQAPTLIGAQPPVMPGHASSQPTLMGAQPPLDTFGANPPAYGGPMGAAQQPTLIGAMAGAAQFAPPPRGGPQVIDVTPRGLGIGTVAGYCEELIRRNSRVPAEMHKVFSTSRDQQSMVRIRVCQGESRRLDDNVILGDLVLEGLPARPRGETSIEVTFQLDASGILQVRARDSKTGQEQRASLDIVGAQSPAEVDAARERFSQLRR